jgi:glycerate-2-kinase
MPRFVKNYKTIGVTKERRLLLTLLEKGIYSVTPENCVRENISVKNNTLFVGNKKYNLKNRRIFVVGGGKASASMAYALERVLGPKRITKGVVISNVVYKRPKKIAVYLADHPYPTNRNIKAVEKIFKLKKTYSIRKGDIVFALVSGGGSALLSYPENGISLYDKRRLYELFRIHGVPDHKTAIVKTKISQTKGGRLGAYFYPADVISLVVSDDNGESGHQFTAAGPFVNHPSTAKDAINVLKEYSIWKSAPKSIKTHLLRGTKKKTNALALDHVHQKIIATNERALTAIKNTAEKQGIKTYCTPHIKGEAQEVAKILCKAIEDKDISGPTLFLYGGETVVTLSKRKGIGGRNQEFIAACLSYLRKSPRSQSWFITAFGTDGVDYIRKSAGGIADKNSLTFLLKQKYDIDRYIETHDTYNILKKINSNIYIDHTGTNVGDIIMFYKN